MDNTAFRPPSETENLVQAHTYPDKGPYNGYKCEKCGVITLTMDVDDGVTPMFLVCRAEGSCDGQSVSLGYPSGPVPEELLPVRFEWYRPDQDEINTLEPSMIDHVSRGGLVLRPVS